MQPLVDRLRSLDSIPTASDDAEHAEDAEFTRRKAESQTKLKSRWEQIIEKYENMPDSKSDVVDIQKGEIVVDNGHLRMQQKDPKALETQHFLGDFINDNGHYDEDSEDELATLEPATSVKPKAQPKPQRRDQTEEIPRAEQWNALPTLPPQLHAPATPMLLHSSAPTAGTHLTTALVQQQSPLNPLTLMNHNASMQALRQFILQTVAEAHGLPQQSPALPTTPQCQTPAIQTAVGHYVPPATDPKWCFPSFEAIPKRPDPSLGPSSARKRQRIMSAGHVRRVKSKLNPMTGLATPLSSVQGHVSSDEVATDSAADEDSSGPMFQEAELQQELGAIYLGHDCHPDRQTMSPRRRRSLPTPSSPPHWEHVGRPNDSHEDTREDTKTTVLPSDFSEEDMELLSLTGSDTPKKVTEETPEQSPSKYFRDVVDDVLEGLGHGMDAEEATILESSQPRSLADGTNEVLEDSGKETPRAVHYEVTPADTAQNEAALPLVENSPLARLPSNPQVIKHPRVVVEVKIPRVSAPVLKMELSPERASPPKNRTPRETTPILRVASCVADSEDDGDDADLALVPTGETPEPEVSFGIVPSIETPQTKPRLPESIVGPGSEAPDELDGAPVMPYIKREPTSPEPVSLLSIPVLSTPKSAPHTSTFTATPKSTPKLNKSQIGRIARAQWAKQRRASTPQRVRPRKSLPVLKKRDWRDEDSEDELAR